LGTYALQQQAVLPDARIAWAGVAALLALRLGPARRRFARALLRVAAGLAVGCGAAAWRAAERMADELPLAWEWRDVELVGVVAGLPQSSERGVRFVLDVDRAITEGAVVPRRVSLMWYAESASAPPAL